jgi:hypothetical protein
MLELLFGLLVVGLLAAIAIPCVVVLGGLILVANVVFWLIALPFQILFHGLGALVHGAGFVLGSIAKFLAALVVLAILLVVGLVFIFVPLLPFLPFLLALGGAWIVYRLVRRPSRTAARA